MKDNFRLIIDFDSTFIKVESLEKLAEMTVNDSEGRKKMLLKEMAEITDCGMNGTLSFQSSLEARVKLLSFNKKSLGRFAEYLKTTVSESIKRHRDFFRKYKNQIYVVSGGFGEYIWPVVRDYGIKKSHIFSNSFIFDNGGEVRGFDHANPLSFDCGKALKVKSMAFSEDVYVLGDGYTDLQIRQSGAADRFFAFTENVRRERVIAKADFVVDDFDQFIYIINQL